MQSNTHISNALETRSKSFFTGSVEPENPTSVMGFMLGDVVHDQFHWAHSNTANNQLGT